MTQSQALAILKTGANVFLTGHPGSGKTHTINAYIQYLREHEIEPAVTASTGIAATHLNGLTIHSWSGIGIRTNISEPELEMMKSKNYLLNRLLFTKVLVIDEISMLNAQTLNMVDQTLQFFRENDQPFGGMQVIFVGDFFQLPPVTKPGEQTQFAFDSAAWQAVNPVVCYLSEQHRQEDQTFLQVLTAIRQAKISPEIKNTLHARILDMDIDAQYTRLFAHNLNVDRVNLQWLQNLETEQFEYHMTSKGRRTLADALKKGCLSPELLVLKKGARVMFTKNNFEEGFVNGTTGEVIDLTENNLPIVKTTDGDIIEVEPMEWSVVEGDKTLASISQLPLRLAWAITIHKSQGMTLDRAVMDLSQSFEYGQGYVALSRVRSLSGLYLLGLNDRALEVHPDILTIDEVFYRLSETAVQKLQQLSASEIATKHQQFIIKVGGSIKKVKKKKKNNTSVDKSTLEITLELWQQGKTVEQIAEIRELVPSTILGHIGKLAKHGMIDKNQLQHLIPAHLKKDLSKINQAFQEFGDEKLKPIFEKFNGKYSYEELRIAQMVR